MKKVLLKISRNSQENTCARASFLINLQTSGLELYLKQKIWHMCLPVSFATFLRTPFIEHPRWLFGIVYFSVFPAVNVGTHAYL